MSHRITAVCLMALPLVTACTGNDHRAEKAGQGPVVVVKGAQLATVASAALPDSWAVTGTVRSRTSALVSARIPGTVNLLKVREGDRVRKGQLIMQLEAQESLAHAAGAAAGIEEARRGLEEAGTRKKLADATFARFRKLFNEQAVTLQEFEIRQSERDLATQGVARAEARLRQAEAGARASSILADYTKIVAPLSGVITSKQVHLGATVFPAQPLLTIEDDNDCQFELAIPESLAAKIKSGTPVHITFDALNLSFDSKIAEIVPAVDPGNRTFTAKVNLSHRVLKSGMFGRADIELGTGSKGILIPKEAIHHQGAMSWVWTVAGDNIARMRLVRIGKAFGDKVEIVSGLSDGDRLIVRSVEKVSEGARVE